MNLPRVSLIAPAIFNSLPIAQSLYSRGLLSEVQTTWPYSRRFSVAGVPANGLNWGGIVGFLGHRLEGALGVRTPWEQKKNQLIQQNAIARLMHQESVSVLYALSTVALKVFETFPNKVKILDRASGHIVRQCALISHEYQSFGVRPPCFDQQRIQEQTAEYGLADIIVVPSSFAKRTFLDVNPGFASKLRVVQFGQGFRGPSAGTRNSIGKTRLNGRVRFGYLGNVSFQKSVPRLLQAFRSLPLSSAELHIAGHVDADVRPFLKNLPENIIYHGKIPNHQLQSFYENLDVFVQPSAQEGLAMVIGEAFSKGIPVLASANTGAEDLFTSGECGLIFEAANTPALKEALETAMSAEKRALWRDHLQVAFGRFKTWKDYGDQVADLVQSQLK